MKFTVCLKCAEQISNNNFAKHRNFCDGSGKRKPGNPGMRGKWSKGLTKETDQRLKEQGRKTSLALKGRTGHKCSEEHKIRLSELAKARGLGGITQSRWIEYGGYKHGSSYEVALAKDLDDNGIEWTKPCKFNYLDKFAKKRTYTPDFYLPQHNVYLDPKNDFLINNINPSLGFSNLEKISLCESQNNIKIIVLSKTQLTWKFIKSALYP